MEPPLTAPRFGDADLYSVRDAIAVALRSYEPPDAQKKALAATPARWLRALFECTSGYDVDTAALLATQFDDVGGNTTLVGIRDVEFASVCEHHLLPFHGTASIAYVPATGRVVGLSKLARLIDAHARRFQLQERLAGAIAAEVFRSHGLASFVVVDVVAKHACLTCRGAMKPGASMVTRVVLGDPPPWFASANAALPAF